MSKFFFLRKKKEKKEKKEKKRKKRIYIIYIHSQIAYKGYFHKQMFYIYLQIHNFYIKICKKV